MTMQIEEGRTHGRYYTEIFRASERIGCPRQEKEKYS